MQQYSFNTIIAEPFTNFNRLVCFKMWPENQVVDSGLFRHSADIGAANLPVDKESG